MYKYFFNYSYRIRSIFSLVFRFGSISTKQNYTVALAYLLNYTEVENEQTYTVKKVVV